MSARIAVFDYGSGNLPSVTRAVSRVGAQVSVTADVSEALGADGVVIPGVGAFSACMQQLQAAGGEKLVTQRVSHDAPLLGICVGMQVLFEESGEHGATQGLGVLPGRVGGGEGPPLPHMGWSVVEADASSVLFDGVEEEERFYFAHSFAAPDTTLGVRSYAVHGERFLATVEHGCVSATQFHPEKSGDAGAQLLSNWVRTL